MKTRTLIITALGILVVSSVLTAQQADVPEPQLPQMEFQKSDSPPIPEPESLLVAQTPSPTSPRPRTPEPTPRTVRPSSIPQIIRPTHPEVGQENIRIFELKHVQAHELARLLEVIFRVDVHSDNRLNRVIVNAHQESMESIEHFVEATDVADPEASLSRDVQNLLYRIYMFEIPSEKGDMKPFSIILRTTHQLSSTELLDAVMQNDLHISEILQGIGQDERESEFLIQGRAASDNSIKNMVGSIPNSRIKQIQWDNAETFTDNIESAQYTQLPEQMQKHIAKFLGDDIRTVGYWFGNLSVPGEVKAPIGPWTLKLKLDTESDHMLELNVDVEMPGDIDEMHNFDRLLGRERNNEILSNTIRAKIGKPIIIGYNRESYGTRKTGALVIIPEADPVQSDAAATNPNRF